MKVFSKDIIALLLDEYRQYTYDMYLQYSMDKYYSGFCEDTGLEKTSDESFQAFHKWIFNEREDQYEIFCAGVQSGVMHKLNKESKEKQRDSWKKFL